MGSTIERFQAAAEAERRPRSAVSQADPHCDARIRCTRSPAGTPVKPTQSRDRTRAASPALLDEELARARRYLPLPCGIRRKSKLARTPESRRAFPRRLPLKRLGAAHAVNGTRRLLGRRRWSRLAALSPGTSNAPACICRSRNTLSYFMPDVIRVDPRLWPRVGRGVPGREHRGRFRNGRVARRRTRRRS
jgi:hypothetical protein